MIRLLSIFRKPLHPEAWRNLFVWGRVDHTPVRAQGLMSIDPSEGLKQFKRVHGPLNLSIFSCGKSSRPNTTHSQSVLANSQCYGKHTHSQILLQANSVGHPRCPSPHIEQFIRADHRVYGRADRIASRSVFGGQSG